MRLSPYEVKIIKLSVKKNFSPLSKVYLFGSRTDDKAKGGDIDLLVETDKSGVPLQEAVYRTMADISIGIGDQKIDIVTCTGMEKEKSLILSEAEKVKILL